MKHFLDIYILDFDEVRLVKFCDELECDQDAVIEIYLCAEREWYFFTHAEIVKKILNIKKISTTVIKKILQSDLYIITGTSKFNNYKSRSSRAKFLYWDTYQFTLTYAKLKKNIEKTANFKYHYISFNGRFRNHRAQLIDEMYHNNLFDYGKISWNGYPGSKPSDDFYVFKYWAPEIKYIDISPEMINEYNDLDKILCSDRSLRLQFIPPIEYDLSFMQIVPETKTDRHYISEKTITPLLLKKPFLSLSSKEFHNILTNYGFKLYDEIFDYSFDEVDSLDKRIEGIILNLKNITKYSLEECDLLYKKIEDKLEYNKNMAIKIAKDNTLIPDICLQYSQYFPWNSDCYKILMEN